MSDTTVTITEPLKDHLKEVKRERGLSSLNDTIQSVLDEPVEDVTEVADGNMDENPAPVKVSDYTHSWLKMAKEQSDHTVYEDVLREHSGASPRDRGEEPIEWEPL